jgi:hexosaminidase
LPRPIAAIALALACIAGAARADPVSVTPRPLSVEPAAGPSLRLASGAAVRTPAGDAGAVWAASYLREMALRSRGLILAQSGAGRAARIEFTREGAPDLGPEGYTLEVGDGRAVVGARTDAGLFYGAVTLWRLMTADGARGPVTLAPVRIEDRPRFAWRGLLLDSARHYQSPAFIEQLIDRMARDKLNVLQWHLTDDQAWRLQIRRYPRLTSVGAWRAAVDPYTGRATRYGGYYSQADVRRIVAYAAQRQVTIVPEIDTPGHALSAILAYPHLGVAPADPKTQGDWGVFPSIIDPDEATIDFMQNVFAEVMALFPSHWINVGGDEAVKDEWRASPKVQAQMKQLGLADEEALQGWYLARLGRFLSAHGRRMIGWDDILKGGAALPPDAAVVSWHMEGAMTALAQGRDVVIATDPTLYLDHRQSGLPSEPPGRGAVISLQDVYDYEPAPTSLPADQRGHIIGVQANLWTEHMPSERDVALMAFPRVDALAELGWTAPERKDWADFQARLPAELARDRVLGLAADDETAQAREDARLQAERPGRLANQQLTLCTQKVELNLQAPLTRQRSQRYLVDIMNRCWIYPQADLSARRELRVAVTRLPFNFQLGADAAKIVLAPPATPAGELEVRADGCTGAPVAVLPLARAAASDGVTVLSGALPALGGRRDLCFTFTARKLDPMWVIGWAEVGS